MKIKYQSLLLKFKNLDVIFNHHYNSRVNLFNNKKI
jgi:hypothetical protein